MHGRILAIGDTGTYRATAYSVSVMLDRRQAVGTVEAPDRRPAGEATHSRARTTRFPWAVAVLAAMIVVSFAIRLDGITAPPFDNAVSRQFHAAMVARTYYVDRAELTTEQRRVADVWDEDVELIEPPVMELLAVAGYHAVGHEALWIPRVLSSVWWALGAVLLYLLALRLQRPPAALAACAIYLFLPFGVVASRAFQPDPLLVVLILLAVLAIVRDDEGPSWGRLAAATAASSVALFLKPGVAAPFLFAVFAILAARRVGVRTALTDGRLAVFALSVVPMFVWYVYGSVVESFLGGHFRDKVSPSLLLERSFWSSWWDQLVYVLTWPVGNELLAAVIVAACVGGVALTRAGRPRTLLVSLWAGYVLFGLVFTLHISTHNYYSLPAVPIVALSLGALLDAALSRLRISTGTATALVAAATAVVAVTVAWRLHPVFTDPAYEEKADRYRAIGEAADHTARALYVDEHYGDPASYYGWMSGKLLASGWEDEEPDVLARRELAAALAGDARRTCVVLTGGPLRPRVRSFEAELAARYAVRSRTDSFAIFDLDRSPPAPSDGC